MDGLILSGARRLTQSTLFERAARAASGFHALTIAENDAVALVLRNDFAFFEAAMGAGLLGAYAVPVNWHFKVDEASYIIQDCGAKALVVHADLLPQIRDGIPPGTSVFIVPTPPRSAMRTASRRMPGGATGRLRDLGRQPAAVDPPAARHAPT
jgi:long-chain acyl-CoA synthetase